MESKLHPLAMILGVPVDSLSMPEALDRLEAFIQEGRAAGIGHQVATVNVDFVTNAWRDPHLLRLLQNVSLALPDGMPVVWAGRSLGVPMPERVTGVDVVMQLAKRAARQGYTLYLLGAAPQVAARAAEILQEKFPGLQIAGIQSPVIDAIEETDPGLIEEIRAARPDILLVAFGNPKQEKWIAHYGRRLGVPVMMGIGGTLDLISGNKRRAPRWMQAVGLEWVFRLAQEPGRLWRRYGLDMLVFGSQFAKQWLLMRPQRASHAAARFEPPRRRGDYVLLAPTGGLSTTDLTELARLARQALDLCPRLCIDLASAPHAGSAVYGEILRISRLAQAKGGGLTLINAPASMRRTLALFGLEALLGGAPASSDAVASTTFSG